MDTKKKHEIRVGDRVDVSLGKPTTYRTIIEDLLDGDRAVISTPLHRGIPIILHRDEEISIYFYREVARFRVDAKVLDFVIEDNVSLVIVKFTSEPVKQQRRSSFRCKAGFEVVYRYSVDGPFPTRPRREDKECEVSAFSEDISETGISLRVPSSFTLDETIYLKIFLKYPQEDSPPFFITGKVRQVKAVGETKRYYIVGVEFVDISEEYRRIIARYVLVRQQQLLKIIDTEE